MNILIAIVSGFAGGVSLRSLFYFRWEPVVFVMILAALFVGAIFFTEARRAYSLAAVFCVFVALGMVRAMVADTPAPEEFMRDLRHRVSYEGVVVADPDMRDANQRVEILIKNDGSETVMLAVAPRHPSVAVGDRVFVSGTLDIPQPFAGDNGRVFRYDKYLERDGVRFMLNFAYLRVEQEAPWHSVPAALARIKHAFLNGIRAALPEPYASLAGGVVIGGKSGLGNELKDAFTRSGLIHIVVLSGHNVMIVASWVIVFFTFVFARMESVSGKRVPRTANIATGALALILFVGIAGASATAIRAALMALIALYARATNRTYAAGRALFVVIFLMLLWNPLYLVFDPGFGLSVVATAGLIWLAPLIELRLAFLKNEFLRSATATTLSAQIAVLPLLLYQTGNLSLVAIPANVLAALLMPFAMAFSYLAGFGGSIFGSIALTANGSLAPFLSIIVGAPAYLAAAGLIWLAETSAALPFAAFTLPPFPFWLVLAAYAALIYRVASKRFSTTPQLRLAKNASI